jgi:hypothetical protein
MTQTQGTRRTRILTVPLCVGDNTFHFRLNTRPLSLGPDVSVQYYWIDSAQLRSKNSSTGMSNFRAIVDFWAAGMHEKGWFGDPVLQLRYVLARAHRLVVQQKALQDVFRDAFPGRGYAQLGADALPDDVRSRIHAVVESRDRTRLGQELDDVLGYAEPPAALMPLFDAAFYRWAVNGVVSLQAGRSSGLNAFLEQIECWSSRFRKRCDPWIRSFLNYFGYATKVAFHTCYANAWIWIISWLRDQRNLDPLSERFLRFWHFQNQPVEAMPGRTISGLYLPTAQRVLAGRQDRDGTMSLEAITLQSEAVGPTYLPDVFRGHVLALHPLSAFFMSDPGLCSVAGRFFSGPGYELVLRRRGGDLSTDYWHLLGAILSAAHLYRRALERQAMRPSVLRKTARASSETIKPDQRSTASYVDEYFEMQGIVCTCGGKVHAVIDENVTLLSESTAVMSAICTCCGNPMQIKLDENAIRDWFFR